MTPRFSVIPPISNKSRVTLVVIAPDIYSSNNSHRDALGKKVERAVEEIALAKSSQVECKREDRSSPNNFLR